MSLRTYLAKRMLISVGLFFSVLIFNFFIFRLPVFIMGMDPLSLYIQRDMELETRENLRAAYGLPSSDPDFWEWLNHFLLYMRNMIFLDFGFSFQTFTPVVDRIMERLPNTLLLMGSSTFLSILIGVIIGIAAASRHGGKFDTAMITIGLSLYSFPVFWIGMMLLLFLSYYLDLFPLGHSVSGSHVYETGGIVYLVDLLWHLVLPCTTLTVAFFGGYMLLMRNTLVEILTEDYILTARAKGLYERTVLFRHGLRNAFLPLITVIAISFAFIVSGAVLTETVFAWFGMGRLLFESLLSYDWPVCQAIFYLIAICVIAANIIADVLYGVLDPRIKYG
jgi:peptide/nickel transport system permease protein